MDNIIRGVMTRGSILCIAIASGLLLLPLIIYTIAKIVCERMRKEVLQDMITPLNRRVQTIEQQLKRLVQEKQFDGADEIREKLQTLSRLVQEQTIRYRRDEGFLERLEKLEKEVHGGENPVSDRVSPQILPEITKRVKDEYQQPPMASRSSMAPEAVAFRLLDLIEPEGRRSQLTRMAGLNDWLRKNHPGIVAEPIGTLNQDLWRLVVLTSDQKTGIVTPALDSIVGPQESLKWFEGGRYDGTQALVRADVSALAKAVRDEETQTWQPHLKGKIDLT